MGFTLSKQECRDINECKEYNERCPGKLHCTNSIGSYACGCLHGYETNGTYCVDIDECVDQGVCPENAVCLNTGGSYNCQCDAGFQGDLCKDIDECLAETNNCDRNATCSNLFGNYTCSCNQGYHGDGGRCLEGDCDDMLCPETMKCVSATTSECECRPGFVTGQSASFCEDFDECESNHDCHENATCTNSDGSYTCTCDSGYEGNGTVCIKGFCTEDMCLDQNQECISPTKSGCRCQEGYERDDDQTCVDTDECENLSNTCNENADCTNTDGSYMCSCNEGTFGNGRDCFPGTCPDANCPENQKCVSPTTLDCECKAGFQLDSTMKCVNIDECEIGPCDKNAVCEDTIGNFTCTCNPGFGGDGKSCFALEILVLLKNKPAVVITSAGENFEIDSCFEADERTTTVNACSLNFRNELYVFGGSEKRQISRLIKYNLKRIGDLNFDHEWGSCGVIEQEIFLCFNFGEADNQKCRKSSDPLQGYVEVAPSLFKHNMIRTSHSDSELVAVGGKLPYSLRSEYYNNGEWTSVDDYPYASVYIFEYATVYFKNFFYFIVDNYKGKCGRLSSETWVWSEVGSLNPRSRRGHSVIMLGNKFMVVGGSNYGMKTESCILYQTTDGEKFNCTDQAKGLTYKFI